MSVVALNFGNNVFMAVLTNGFVYTSPDAEIWTQVGKINISSTILLYGNGKWVCGSLAGYICCSKDNGRSWEDSSNGLYRLDNYWCGAWYASSGCYYAICQGRLIAVSRDGENWKSIFAFSGGSTYQNVTYFKNKIWTYDVTGSTGHIGLPRPDGTIDFYSAV